MKEMLSSSVFFGIMLTLLAYEFGLFLKKKLKVAVCNPLLIAIVVVIIVLAALGIDYEQYEAATQPLSYLLTPATVCLAIPLYEQVSLLKKNMKAILAGIVSGVLTSLCSILVLALLFGLSHEEYVTILPKSITTAIGIGISEELGGIVSVTVAMIIVTGIFGNVVGEFICRVFHIKEPVARGIAIGASSHAIGTAKAMEMGEIEGAMSSLSIAAAGLLTVVGASVFAQFL